MLGGPLESGNPQAGAEGRSNNEHELQSLDHHRSFSHHRVSEPQQISLYAFPGAPTPESPRATLPTRIDQELHSRRRTIDAEYQSTETQGCESQERLLGDHKNMASSFRSSVSTHKLDAFANPRISHHFPSVRPSVKSKPYKNKVAAHRYWAWEISASILSIACIASVIGVLIYEDGKPLNQWGLGQRYLSPNVVVSLLGTLGKSACLVAIAEIVSQLKWLHFQRNPHQLSDLQLFDDASRGPWGALQLAFCKNLKTLLATCASIITIASLLIDPFIQSSFQFPSILTPVQDDFPKILANEVYDPTSIPFGDGQCSDGVISTTMQAAVLTPIWNSTKQPFLPCNFERCDWPTITTLGACSSCIDLTDTVTSTCKNVSDVAPMPDMTPISLVECNYTLPNSNNILNAVFGVDGSDDGAEYSTIWDSASEMLWIPPILQSDPESIYYKFISEPALFSNFTFLQFDPVFVNYRDGRQIFERPLPKKAMQCTLQLCARTFEKPHYSNFTEGPLTGPQVHLLTSDISTQTVLANEGIPIFFGLEPENAIATPLNGTFRMNYCNYKDLIEYLRDLFTFTLNSGGIISTSVNGSEVDNEHIFNQVSDRNKPNVGWVLGQSDDIPALMQQIADSITEEIRTSVNNFSTDGVGRNTEIFIVIKWAWLALPISVMVLTFVLLVVVIITNHTRGMPLWKSSSLALLFHEVDGWNNSDMIVSGPEEMQARAKEMKSQVTYKEGHLLFSKAE